MYPSMTLGTLWWIPLNVGIALGQPHCNGWGKVVLESLLGFVLSLCLLHKSLSRVIILKT